MEARRLRELAKQMVRGLYRIANHHGHNIQEPIDYYKAIGLKPPAAPYFFFKKKKKKKKKGAVRRAR